MIETTEFLSQINDNPTKSMGDVGWLGPNLVCNSWESSLAIVNDEESTVLPWDNQELLPEQRQAPPYKLKHQEEPEMLLFLSNQKNFAHVKKVNHIKNRDGLSSYKMFWRVSDTRRKFPASLMILRGSREASEDDLTRTYFLL